MSGIILINKPVGITSTECVRLVRTKFDNIKTGHTGTLDSTASGLLIVLTGNATRLSNFLMALPKVYVAEVKLGAETDTNDYAGEIINSGSFEHVNENLIDDVLYKFMGLREQVPPEISALKINGQPAHELKRSGQDVRLTPRPIMIYEIKRVSDYDKQNGIFKLQIKCGRGTYIRSIARDIGRIFNCGAHLKSLKRISTGIFNIFDENINPPDAENFKITPVQKAALNFNSVLLSEYGDKKFFNGSNVFASEIKIFRPCQDFISNSKICVVNKTKFGFAELKANYLKPFAIVPVLN